MHRLIILTAIFAFSGCASIDLWRRSHPFEHHLYVDDLSIAHLTKAEWEEIKAQFAKRTEYSFRDASRESTERVVVNLELNSDRYKGLKLRFDQKDGKWIENEAKAQTVDYLIP